MIKLKNNKTFMDSVHGYIGVPNCFVENLIDTDYFQRLRNIDQTGTRILYPCVKHDRFSHSIGVFHLGQRAVDSLLESFYEMDEKHTSDEFKEELERNRILFMIACLLHDIGHTPFSHSLEALVLGNSKIQIKDKDVKISKNLADKINNIEEVYDEKFNIKKNQKLTEEEVRKVAAHEQLGSHLIIDDFKDRIKNVMIELSILYSKNTDIKKEYFEEATNSEISDVILNDDLSFIARMIMGLKYTSFNQKRQIRNCFIELLNGENFDVDKLDYIIRDTQMSGIRNVDLDVERLLKSVSVNPSTKYYNKEFENKYLNDERTFINVKNLNNEKYIQVNGNLKGSIVLKKGAKVEINKDSFFNILKGKIKIDKCCIGVFDNKTKAEVDFNSIAASKEEKYGEESVIIIKGNDKEEIYTYLIENAKLLENFKFEVIEDTEFIFNSKCDIKIKGKFNSTTAITSISETNFNGHIDEVEILGNSLKKDYKKEREASENGYNIYRICFKKQAINVIANVLKARNFLYLWIYAHHKVVYYANFLIPVLTSELSKKINNGLTFPNWELSYKNIKYLDDCYIWTLMRYILYMNKNDENYTITSEIEELINEALNRKYKHSLYKSLVEYDLFIESFIKEHNSEDLIKKISELIDTTKPYIGNSETNQYDVGYFNSNSIKEINEKCALLNCQLSELIFVVANYKFKNMQSLNVHIDMGNQNYIPISRIPLLDVEENKNRNISKKYFYLYYKTKDELSKDFKVEELRKVIGKFLGSKLSVNNKN